MLSLADAHAGQHLTTLGADEPGKCDLSADLLAAASLTVDHIGLARTSGVLADPALTAAPLAARLASPACERPSLSVHAPVGLPWQDLALSWLAFARATARGVGTSVELLA